MIVLGLDIATSTGWCLIEEKGRPQTWHCGAIKAKGAFQEELAASLAFQLLRFFKYNVKPDFVAIEMPMRNVQQFKKRRHDLAGQHESATINPAALKLSAFAGAAAAVIDCYSIPWGLVAPATWRPAYFGKGVKPNGKWTAKNKDNLRPSYWSEDWKELAINYAKKQNISLPSTRAAQRDAAEACGIACAWELCTAIPERHQNAFMLLRTKGVEPA